MHFMGVEVAPDGEARIVCRTHVASPAEIRDAAALNRIARQLFEPLPDPTLLRWRDADAYVPPRTAPDKARTPTATFEVEYHGFSSEAHAAFQYAVDLWSTRIESGVTIRIEASWSSLEENVLGSAGPTYFDDADSFDDPTEPTAWFVPALANAKRGQDDFPNEADIVSNFNNDFTNWYFGLDGETPSGTIDFVTVVLHEIGHGLGFLGSMKVDNGADGAECGGTEGEGCWGFSQFPTVPVIYDRFAEDAAGDRLIDTSVYPKPSMKLGNVLQGGQVLFAGNESVATFAGGRPPLYSPDPWESGSSYSHWDESAFPPGDPSALMTPSVSPSEAIHDPGPLGCALFADIGWSIGSDCGTFAPPETPAVPVLISPPDGTQDVDPPVTLTWHSADRADTYRLQVAETATFQTTVVSTGGLTDTTFTVENLDPDTEYFWRVRSSNADEQSEYSIVYDFRTAAPAPPAPAAPVLTSPADGAGGVPTDVTLSWEAAANASRYRVQLAATEDFSTKLVNATTSATSFDVNGLEEGTTYFWRVRGINESGPGSWSQTFDFTTIQPMLAAPGLVSPKDGATGVDTSLVLEWTVIEAAETYRVQLDTDSAFSDPLIDNANLDQTSFEVSGLESETTYFWRVRAENGSEAGAWSAIFSFSTDPAVPVVPDAIQPEDGATDVAIPTLFSWSEAVEADYYELQVALDSAFTELEVDSSRIDTTRLLLPSLDPATSYVWRVRAINEVGRSIWTVGSRFTTATGTGDETDDRLTDSFGFTGAYPNPFDDRIALEFVLPQAMHVRLSIFDVQGRRVGLLLDEPRAAGRQEVTWMPAGLSSGMYLCRLDAESGTSTRTIVRVFIE